MEPRGSCSLVFTVSHEQTLPSVSQIQSGTVIGCLLFFLPMFPNNLVKRMSLSIKRGTGEAGKKYGQRGMGTKDLIGNEVTDTARVQALIFISRSLFRFKVTSSS